MTRLVLNQHVAIDVTLANPQTGPDWAPVRVGGTNVNETLLRDGLARLNRDQIRVLPLLDQYALVRAERLARRERIVSGRLPQPRGCPGPEAQ